MLQYPGIAILVFLLAFSAIVLAWKRYEAGAGRLPAKSVLREARKLRKRKDTMENIANRIFNAVEPVVKEKNSTGQWAIKREVRESSCAVKLSSHQRFGDAGYPTASVGIEYNPVLMVVEMYFGTDFVVLQRRATESIIQGAINNLIQYIQSHSVVDIKV